MRIVDLSHPLHSDMPLYPGVQPPGFTPLIKLEESGYRESLYRMSSHTGTHVDAPAHVLAKGAYLDQMPVERFFGLALLVDVSGWLDQPIPAAVFERREEDIARSQFLALASGWDAHWGGEKYYRGGPVLSREAAEYLAGFPLYGLGMDFPSVDPIGSIDLPCHRALLSAGMILIENLTGLTALPERFLLSCFPLAYPQADGASVRALAYLAPAGIYYPQ